MLAWLKTYEPHRVEADAYIGLTFSSHYLYTTSYESMEEDGREWVILDWEKFDCFLIGGSWSVFALVEIEPVELSALMQETVDLPDRGRIRL